jgi:2-keto-3-deoxy-L-rhamnonate aldolase RhmA
VADCGAAGIIVPHVDTVDEARHIVAALRFAPQGKRSIPSPIALTGFRPVPARELVALSEHALEITVMIESTEAMACLDDIAAVDSIDGLMVGTNDLVASMGLIGQPEHADVCTAFATIAATARDHGRDFSVIGLPTQLLQSHALSLGAGLVVVTNDINLLFEAGEARVRNVRALADRMYR